MCWNFPLISADQTLTNEALYARLVVFEPQSCMVPLIVLLAQLRVKFFETVEQKKLFWSVEGKACWEQWFIPIRLASENANIEGCKAFFCCEKENVFKIFQFG